MNQLREKMSQWPEPGSCVATTKNRRRVYPTPYGDLPPVTTILKVLGLGTEALMKWAANQEREAVLLAATEVYLSGKHGEGPAEFHSAIESHLGEARAHAKLVREAGDLGTATHQMVNWTMRKALGLEVGPEPALLDRSLWAFMAFEDWWKTSGLKVVRTEQPVWDLELGYAGTIDIVAENPAGELGIIDLKTSNYIYDEHHLQVSAYMHAARNFDAMSWATIVRVPKNIEDASFETQPLGKMHKRTLTEDQLFGVFANALSIYRTLTPGASQ